MQLTKLLTGCSLLAALIGCGGVPRPDTELCIINAPGENRKCYNLKNDYNDDGHLRAGATPVYKPNKAIIDLNKSMCIDSPTGFEDGLARLKEYIKNLREACKK